MLINLLKFEGWYQTRQIPNIIFSVAFFLIGFYFCSAEGAINLSRPSQIHVFVSLMGLMSVFQVMIMLPATYLRDGNNHMHSLTFSSGVSKFPFLFAHFTGSLMSYVFSSLLYVLGLYFYAHFDFLNVHINQPFHFYYFFVPWISIVVPSIFFTTAILFFVATTTRNTAIVFVTGLVLFISFWINNFFIGAPFTGGKLVVEEGLINTIALLDPFGLCAYFQQTHFWSPLEKSTRMLSFSGQIVWNRIIWSGLSLCLLAISYFSFSFTRESGNSKKEANDPNIPTTKKLSTTRFNTICIDKNSLSSVLKELRYSLKMNLGLTFKNRIFILIWISWWGMITIAVLHNLSGQDIYGNVLPGTGIIIEVLLEPLGYIGILVITLFAGELVWSDRQSRFNEIIDVLPTQSWISFLSKFFAVLSIIFSLIATGIIIGVLIQTLKGYSNYNLSAYSQSFFYGGFPLFLYTCITFLVQYLSDNKYVGFALSPIVYFGLGYVFPLWGISHPLLSFFQLPKVSTFYSDFTGFGQMSHAFQSLSIVWGLCSLIILLLTIRLVRRGTEENLRIRLKSMVSDWSYWQQRFLIVISVLLLISAINIWSEVVDYQQISDKKKGLVMYENTFKKYAHLPPLDFTKVKTYVDLYPSELSYHVKGDYEVKNSTNQAIDSVLVTAPVSMYKFEIENGHTGKKINPWYDARIITFDPPIAPNEIRNMRFSILGEASHFEKNIDLMENGTYLRNSTFEPRFGYIEGLEIKSETERAKLGLAKKSVSNPNKQLPFSNDRPKLQFETVITTELTQTALAPGVLIDSAILPENRVRFHYRSEVGMDNTISYISATYQKTESTYKGQNITIYHHPEHQHVTHNINEIVKATLDYCSTTFGQIPSKAISIAEVPNHWKFGGHSLNGLIALNERFFLSDLSNPDSKVNLFAKVIIHELAHQWFGHLLIPKPEKGANLLTETMANYVEGRVLNKLYGERMVRELVDFNRRRYFRFRSESHLYEPPLFLVENEQYVAYRKGHYTMHQLLNLLGEVELNSLLKEYIFIHKENLSATSSNFLQFLKQNIAPDQRSKVEEWFEKRVEYDWQIKSVEIQEGFNNQNSITIKGEVHKRNFNRNGEATDLSISDRIEIGLFDKYPEAGVDISGYPMTEFNIDSGQFEVNVAVTTVPKYLMIDPNYLYLDKDMRNNIYKVEALENYFK